LHIVLVMLIGLVAGALVGSVVRGHAYGVGGDIVVGVVGAFVGGWVLATFLGVGGGGFFISLFMAFVGAGTLLWLIPLLVPARARSTYTRS
jgi:uncharacterized membrane protein YeaQ/YmgE (transglycosylase-associated protein family)